VKDQYEDERPVVALIQVDNYDDVMSETKEDKRPFLTSEIDQKVNLWASRMNALIKKYQTDKYLVLFEERYLENLEAKRFSILDDIREIEVGNKFPMTLSIGVGVNGRNLNQAEEYAFSALELALGRGGDQAVVRKRGNFEFYGGKAKAVEKRNRVKARIIAHGLRPLIDEASNVIIMGHKYPDMDCYGSAIGIYRAVINRGKDAHIVLTGVNEAIKSVHKMFSDNPVYHFVTGEQALNMVQKDTLLVIVDTHRPSYTECPELLDKISRVVLIDHHRRGTEFVENTALKYHEPYASSTCELVTEILQYMDNKVTVEKIEAEALMAGIAVDTKNFTFKTGVRTFEAASLLRRFGADTTVVRQLFQDDLETFIAKSTIVGSAKLYDHGIAISYCLEDIPNAQLIAAQAADELLDIRGISTSFVISVNKDQLIFISGRSLGDVNVQIILEKIGGGGHMTVAGAQLSGCSLEEATNQLLKAIKDYFEEGDKS
jgi:cyclic-di-AMP phosphodiesterase